VNVDPENVPVWRPVWVPPLKVVPIKVVPVIVGAVIELEAPKVVPVKVPPKFIVLVTAPFKNNLIRLPLLDTAT
jgi:hypothetical protein